MISKLTKKGLTEVVVGQIVKEVLEKDLTVLTELIEQLPKKVKLNYLPESLSHTEIHQLLELAQTEEDTKIFKN